MHYRKYFIEKHLEENPNLDPYLGIIYDLPVSPISSNKSSQWDYMPPKSGCKSFSNDELPFERIMHNATLHINIICWDKMINRVFIDDGLSLNVCPLTTWPQFNYDVGKYIKKKVNMGIFNGQKDTIMEVKFYLQIGPYKFKLNF